MPETMIMHGEVWNVRKGANGMAYMLEGKGPFSVTTFYRGGTEYAWVVWDADNDTAASVRTVTEGNYTRGVSSVLSMALDALIEAEDEYMEECEDSYYLSGAADSDPEWDECPEDYMRADSDLMYEW